MTLQKEELTTDTSKLLILGSGSVARKELLKSVGLIPDKIEIPNVDESYNSNESPRNYERPQMTKNIEKAKYMVPDAPCRP